MSAKVLYVRLGQPKHGWIDLQIVQGRKACEWNVADQPDFILELQKAIVALLSGSETYLVELNNEPGFYQLFFQWSEDQVSVGLSFEDYSGKKKKIGELLGSPEEIVLPFWKEIQSFYSRGIPTFEFEGSEFPHWPEKDRTIFKGCDECVQRQFGASFNRH
ncbi:hypothetical protein N9K16_06420 [Alphaproteobacteria bacterium]|nr:hypothetical protein [Alphaproteobacteria bacterium]